jgi:hypothetical protein
MEVSLQFFNILSEKFETREEGIIFLRRLTSDNLTAFATKILQEGYKNRADYPAYDLSLQVFLEAGGRFPEKHSISDCLIPVHTILCMRGFSLRTARLLFSDPLRELDFEDLHSVMRTPDGKEVIPYLLTLPQVIEIFKAKTPPINLWHHAIENWQPLITFERLLELGCISTGFPDHTIDWSQPLLSHEKLNQLGLGVRDISHAISLKRPLDTILALIESCKDKLEDVDTRSLLMSACNPAYFQKDLIIPLLQLGFSVDEYVILKALWPEFPFPTLLYLLSCYKPRIPRRQAHCFEHAIQKNRSDSIIWALLDTFPCSLSEILIKLAAKQKRDQDVMIELNKRSTPLKKSDW